MEFDLWDELMGMERRMDDLFRTFLGARGLRRLPALSVGVRQPYLPAADVYTVGEDLAVRMELPGIDPAKDVTVTIEDGDLVIRGERRRKDEVKEEDYYRMEVSYGAFERRIPLPRDVRDEDVKAQYVDGVLEITVPGVAKVLKPVKPKAIPIKGIKPGKAA